MRKSYRTKAVGILLAGILLVAAIPAQSLSVLAAESSGSEASIFVDGEDTAETSSEVIDTEIEEAEVSEVTEKITEPAEESSGAESINTESAVLEAPEESGAILEETSNSSGIDEESSSDAVVEDSEEAETVLTDGDFEYTVENQNVTITKYIGIDASVIIPQTLSTTDGNFVGYIIAIGENAFADTGVTDITIDHLVKNIADNSFDGLENLIIYTTQDTVAHNYALTHNITVEIIWGDFLYRFENGKATITKAIPTFSRLYIPEEVNGCAVVAIADFAFQGCDDVERVIVPNSVTSIGANAFEGTSNKFTIECYKFSPAYIYAKENNINYLLILDFKYEVEDGKVIITGPGSDLHGTLVIPSQVEDMPVTRIADEAFRGTKGTYLTAVTIPDTVTHIGSQAFALQSIEHLVIPDSVTYISRDAFLSGGLKTVALSKNVKVIESGTFMLTELESVTIPDGVTTIESAAFATRKDTLKSITIPKSVLNIADDIFISSMGPASRYVVVHCYENSAAHTFAKKMGYKFELIEEPTSTPEPTVTPKPTAAPTAEPTPAPITGKDDNTNIGFSAPVGVVPAGTTISVSPVTSGNNFTLADTALKMLADKFTLFDINLMHDGVKINLQNGKVTVSIPVPQGYEVASCKIYRIEADGSKTDMNATVKDGYLVFETEHFSLYAVAQMKAEPTPTPTIAPTTAPTMNPTTSPSNSPQTGDSNNVLPFALVALCSVAGFIFLMIRKKAK